MCGRFTNRLTWEEIVRLYRLTVQAPPHNLPPRYNICPTDPVDVLTERDGDREFVRMRWGLVPSWWPKPLKDLKAATFNARAETVAEASAFRDAFRTHRCLIVADGFGVKRIAVMYNDFILVGPNSDPAGVKGRKDIVAALTSIKNKAASFVSRFVSRGDRSGTHAAELALWKAAGIDVAGADAAETLTLEEALGAFLGGAREDVRQPRAIGRPGLARTDREFSVQQWYVRDRGSRPGSRIAPRKLHSQRRLRGRQRDRSRTPSGRSQGSNTPQVAQQAVGLDRDTFILCDR
jgi:hypothetical protein